jgi:hypothetical protein
MAAGISFFALLALIIPLALLAATAWLWVRVVRGFRLPADGPTPTCAACGAGVRGIASLACPECGADLREVGINTPAQRRRVSPLAFILGWTLLPLLPALVAFTILIAVGPQHVTSRLHFSATHGPNKLTVNATHIGTRSGGSGVSSSTVSGGMRSHAGMTTLTYHAPAKTRPDNIQVLVASPAASLAFTFDHADGDYLVTSPIIPTGSTRIAPAPAPTTLRTFMPPGNAAASGFSDNQIAGTANLLDGLAAGSNPITIPGWSGPSTSSSSMNARPAWWYLVLLVAVFAALYVAGLVLYFRLRARANRPATPPSPAPPPLTA